MKVYINPGHDLEYDSGAIHTDGNGDVDLRECDVAYAIGNRVRNYLEDAGCDVHLLQSDSLIDEPDNRADRPVSVVNDANDWPADLFVSIHCDACVSHEARGTSCLVYSPFGEAAKLAEKIQKQIVDSVGTEDRGIVPRPGLIVLNSTDMPAVLVETAFIDNDEDAALLIEREDDFARAIARGITDYIQGV